MLLGNKIKELRNEHEVLQRQLAAYLEIDTPMFSKIERGDRRAKRSQVIQLAEYFHIDEKKMPGLGRFLKNMVYRILWHQLIPPRSQICKLILLKD